MKSSCSNITLNLKSDCSPLIKGIQTKLFLDKKTGFVFTEYGEIYGAGKMVDGILRITSTR